MIHVFCNFILVSTPLSPHEVVGNTKDGGLGCDLKRESRVKANVLPPIGLEVASVTRSVERVAEVLHESMTDVLTLRVW
jgi:hypothetical protein